MRRIQLTLFVTGPAARDIERVRRLVDPVQSALIRAHVTLCREDELGGLGAPDLAERTAAQAPIRLTFGNPSPFDGHGILLPCVHGAERYAELRRAVLGAGVREASPHLTLAHPRNPRAAGHRLDAVDLALPVAILFERAALIEQAAAGAPWRVVGEFSLGQAAAPTTESARPSRRPSRRCR